MNQGAPYIAAVLAYAIGNQTIAQRLFAVREDLIKPTFITATLGYGATVIGIGMVGVMALYLGVTPIDGDINNLLPQMSAGNSSADRTARPGIPDDHRFTVVDL